MSKRPGSALRAVYKKLYRAFGPQGWWPGQTPFEVAIGAILTQNTAWTNVERAITRIKSSRSLSSAALDRLPLARLQEMIRPAGYFRVKAHRLKNFLVFLKKRGGLAALKKLALAPCRQALLSVNGIGPETADSILLYALGKPVFVIDAYTKRIFSRHGLARADADYDQLQRFFMDHLPRRADFFNEYHALIVRLGKEYCRKTRPRCAQCPLYE